MLAPVVRSALPADALLAAARDSAPALAATLTATQIHDMVSYIPAPVIICHMGLIRLSMISLLLQTNYFSQREYFKSLLLYIKVNFTQF